MHILDRLKGRLEGVAVLLRGRGPIVYVDLPVHLNVGDLLINAGTEEFFRSCAIRIWRRYALSDLPLRREAFSRDVVFVFHGGGNLGDLWEPHQQYRERLLDLYPDNLCIILPQSVHFSSPEKHERSLRRMARHRNLHVFARDSYSRKVLQEAGIANTSAIPDMAHMLFGTFPRMVPATRSSLTLMRQDRETGRMRDLGGMEADAVDWGTMVPNRARAAKLAMVWAVKCAGRAGLRGPYNSFWYPVRDNLVIRPAVRYFQAYQALVTDRLHAMLLGLFLGMKVTAHDNSYGKLSRYCETWLQNCDNLNLCPALSAASTSFEREGVQT